MCKPIPLIALCFSFGSRLTAGLIQDFVITDFTATQSMPGFRGPLVTFSASGPGISIAGGQQGLSHDPSPAFITYPVSAFAVFAGSFGTGTITIDGVQKPVTLGVGGFNAGGFVPPPDPESPFFVTFPGGVTGQFPVLYCAAVLLADCPPPIAEVLIDLPGTMAIGFDRNGIIAGVNFSSTPAPEPSSMLLFLLGAVFVSIASSWRLRRRMSADASS